MEYSFSSLAEFALLRDELRSYLRSLCPAMAERLFVALNEAVNNALIHGTHEDREKNVTVSVVESKGEIIMSVRHDGQGLKRRVPRCGGRTGLEEGGRGLFIISSCVDSFSYDDAGRELAMRSAIKE